MLGRIVARDVIKPGSEDERWQPGTDGGGDFQGAIPMTGFGPGAYILATWALAESAGQP